MSFPKIFFKKNAKVVKIKNIPIAYMCIHKQKDGFCHINFMSKNPMDECEILAVTSLVFCAS